MCKLITLSLFLAGCFNYSLADKSEYLKEFGFGRNLIFFVALAAVQLNEVSESLLRTIEKIALQLWGSPTQQCDLAQQSFEDSLYNTTVVNTLLKKLIISDYDMFMNSSRALYKWVANIISKLELFRSQKILLRLKHRLGEKSHIRYAVHRLL